MPATSAVNVTLLSFRLTTFSVGLQGDAGARSSAGMSYLLHCETSGDTVGEAILKEAPSVARE
jgi:hypothetical protein